MKLHQSKLLQNFHRYQDPSISIIPGTDHSARCPTDTFLLWKYFEYFTPKNALEIGFFKGQSMSIMVEAVDNDIEIISVDKNYQQEYKQNFTDLYPDANIIFHEINSLEISTVLINKSFDFILLDGSDEYLIALNDISKSLDMITANGVIYVDEVMTDSPGVHRAVKELLFGQKGWIPFLAGQSGMFFHHKSHDAAFFLDHFLQKPGDRIFNFYHNSNWNDFDVLFVTHQMMFEDHPTLFRQILELYNL